MSELASIERGYAAAGRLEQRKEHERKVDAMRRKLYSEWRDMCRSAAVRNGSLAPPIPEWDALVSGEYWLEVSRWTHEAEAAIGAGPDAALSGPSQSPSMALH